MNEWGLISVYIFTLFLFFLSIWLEKFKKDLENQINPLSLYRQFFEKIINLTNVNVILPAQYEFDEETESFKRTKVYFANKWYNVTHTTAEIAVREAEKELQKLSRDT